jgi:hypothetical protein
MYKLLMKLSSMMELVGVFAFSIVHINMMMVMKKMVIGLFGVDLIVRCRQQEVKPEYRLWQIYKN